MSRLLIFLLLSITISSYASMNQEFIAGACFLGGLACLSTITIVSTGDECLVERLGKYHRNLGPGLHIVFRPIEAISFKATLREQVLEIDPQECFTADNAPLTADAVVYMKITNVKDAHYKVFDVRNAVMNLCLTNVREAVGTLTLEESFSSRGDLNRRMLASLNNVCREWGVEITRVEIQSLQPSLEIMRAMESQISADRKKRATILSSEGEKTRLINEAEGNAQAMVADAEAKKKSLILASQAEAERQRLEAEGIERAIRTLARAVAGSDSNIAIRFLAWIRFLETQGKFAQTDSTKVLMWPSCPSFIKD